MKRREEEYKLIDLPWTCNLEESIKILHTYETPAKAEFNNHMLYSDMSVDEAYILVIGKTKAEFDKKRQDYLDKLKREEEEYRAQIPTLEEEWRAKGRIFLKEKYWELWDECVPVRLSDLYRGMELGCLHDLLVEYDKNQDLDKVKEIFENQGHSGMSAGLMFSMLVAFHDDGEKIAEYLRY